MELLDLDLQCLVKAMRHVECCARKVWILFCSGGFWSVGSDVDVLDYYLWKCLGKIKYEVVLLLVIL